MRPLSEAGTEEVAAFVVSLNAREDATSSVSKIYFKISHAVLYQAS